MTGAPPHELIALIEAALSRFDDEETGFEGPAVGWRAVCQLHRMASQETLGAAIELCRRAEPTRRRVGAAILGQLGHSRDDPRGVFRNERYGALHALLTSEIEGPGDVKVLNDVCVALGHLNDPRAIPIAAKLLGHPDKAVRSGVVRALSNHDDETAIAGLIELSADQDAYVRDWATFGLGREIETDTPALRAALRARLEDRNDTVRDEAISGLARRKDRDALPALIRELNVQVSTSLFEAAAAFADPALCEALTAAERIGQPWEDYFRKYWREAMVACGCGPNAEIGRQ
jgi:hypothetical protein